MIFYHTSKDDALLPQIKTLFSPKNIKFASEGMYSFDNLNFLKINLENNFNNDMMNLKSNFDYKRSLDLPLINYQKTENSIANLSLNLKKSKDIIKFVKLNFKEGNNFININDLVFKDNKFSSFKKIEVKTNNNNFSIRKDNKILIEGKNLMQVI